MKDHVRVGLSTVLIIVIVVVIAAASVGIAYMTIHGSNTTYKISSTQTSKSSQSQSGSSQGGTSSPPPNFPLFLTVGQVEQAVGGSWSINPSTTLYAYITNNGWYEVFYNGNQAEVGSLYGLGLTTNVTGVNKYYFEDLVGNLNGMKVKINAWVAITNGTGQGPSKFSPIVGNVMGYNYSFYGFSNNGNANTIIYASNGPNIIYLRVSGSLLSKTEAVQLLTDAISNIQSMT
ncbi:hypothetical protein [Metallosphaera hakonensis]|uniref:hypothetical protein n=1 Tax=Metallosphaera hakonensis TaxID=79601 RepID=UPI0011B259DE|nr:hypothetical protein [Metallosphaera hakonensis]